MIEFPDPFLANDEGLLAVGGDLQPQTLLAAYGNIKDGFSDVV